jgi:hypothetical protein
MHDELLSIISEVSGIEKDKITGKVRSRSFMIPRQLLCYYLRKKYKYKLVDIAQLFNAHHSSIIHSVKQIEIMISIRDHETISLITLIDNKIKDTLIDLPKKVILTIPNNLDYMTIFAVISKQFNNCKVEISF